MAKKEVKTDLWVYDLLSEAGISLTPQGCDIKEIDEALKTASKSGTGNVGYPEYCGVVKDFIIVIEDKAYLDKHISKDSKDLIYQETRAIKESIENVLCSISRRANIIPDTIKGFCSVVRFP